MKEFDDLINIVKILRSPKGCPWDRAQKLSDYKRYLIEEAYELIDGINRNDSKEIKEELGDVFLILVIITELFAEKNIFNLENVLSLINQKMVSRHPHVFASKKLKTKEAVLKYWINSKAKKKKRKTIKDRLPLSAPSLALAEIFLRECEHIKKENKSKQKKYISQVPEVSNFNKINDGKSKEGMLLDTLLNICQIAHQEKIDLEGMLRKKIFNITEKNYY